MPRKRCSKTVYSFSVTPGVRERIWDSTTDTGVPHDDVENIFSGPSEGPCRLPSHVNGPAGTDQTETSWTTNTNTGSPNDGPDQYRYEGWIYIDNDGTILSDASTQIGERVRIWLDGFVVYLNNTDTSGATNPPDVFATVDSGWHYLVFEGSDASFFAGITLQQSTDGGTTFEAFSGLTSITTPTISCRDECCDYELQDNEFECPPPVPFSCPTAQSAGQTTDLDLTGLLLCDNVSAFCPVIVGELEGIDGPVDLNPTTLTAVTWGGFQSQDDAVVQVSGTDARIVADDVCTTHVTGSVLLANLDGGTGATGDAQRAAPEVWLMRNGVKWAAGLHTYMRDANGNDSTSANFDRWDLDPAGAVYSISVQEDSIATAPSGQAGATIESPQVDADGNDIERASYLQVAAFLESQKIDCEGNGGGGSPGSTLLPVCSDAIVTFFNEQQFSWGFQIQATTAAGLTQWQYLIEDADYQFNLDATGQPVGITSSGDFTYTETDNGDGTYDHLFTSNSGIAPFGSSNSYSWNGVNFGFEPVSSNQSLRCNTTNLVGQQRLFMSEEDSEFLLSALLAVMATEPNANPDGIEVNTFIERLRKLLEQLLAGLFGTPVPAPTRPTPPPVPEPEPEPEPTPEPEPRPQPEGLRWQQVDKGEPVTWFFNRCDCIRGLDDDDLYKEAASVLEKVEGVCGIRFKEVDSIREADLKFTFAEGDGAGGTLAFAVVPESGNEMSACGPECGTVSQDTADVPNLITYHNVTLHEVIHAVGVPHLATGIMQAFYTPVPFRISLSGDEAVTQLQRKYLIEPQN